MLEHWGIRAMPHGQAAISSEKEKTPDLPTQSGRRNRRVRGVVALLAERHRQRLQVGKQRDFSPGRNAAKGRQARPFPLQGPHLLQPLCSSMVHACGGMQSSIQTGALGDGIEDGSRIRHGQAFKRLARTARAFFVKFCRFFCFSPCQITGPSSGRQAERRVFTNQYLLPAQEQSGAAPVDERRPIPKRPRTITWPREVRVSFLARTGIFGTVTLNSAVVQED